MKIKIISDGTVQGTKVIDKDTGAELEGVVSIEWSVAPRSRGSGFEFHTRLVLEEVPVTIVNDAIKRYELSDLEVITCIGCGCTDLEACDPPCHWVLVDGDVGVCSADPCIEARARFAAGEREVRPPRSISSITQEERDAADVPDLPTGRRET